METNNFYSQICNLSNLILAWRRARKGKTKKDYVMEFEKDTLRNLLKLHEELKNQTYYPKLLKTFILRDPKTRKISKSDFRDRIIHHALIRIIEPIFEKRFIYDSCANQIGKGNLFALKRLNLFLRKVTKNNTQNAYCLKADIKHYFQEVNHKILINIIKRKIIDEKVILLITKILENGEYKEGISMPLGNLTSQFFANVYLSELDYFVKHKLKAKYYIRYVDDFVILHENKEQLEILKIEIDNFLRNNLKIELHPDKSKIIPLSRGIDFVGFRNFYYYKLLRKRNIRKIKNKIKQYKEGSISEKEILESYQGWNAYAKWANSYKLRKEMIMRID
jgi:RNA-directed DNA polymerase